MNSITFRHLAACLALWSGLGAAQGFGFTPTVLTLDPTRTLATQTTMLNTGRIAAKFKVEVKAWTVVNGAMVLQDTRDLIVNPTEFTIAGGASQVVRVGLRKKPGNDEIAFRLIIQQQALGTSVPQTVVKSGDINVTLDLPTNYSLPVYVGPPSTAARMTYAVQAAADGLNVTFQNAGNRREAFNGLVVTRGALKVDLSGFAVLGGATRSVKIPGLEKGTGPLVLSFQNADGKASSVTIQVP